MILTEKTKEGYICAYFEWDVVDFQGNFSNNGRYMHVRDLWVHPNYDGEMIIKKFILLLDKDNRNQDIKWIYWLRNDKRKSRLFSRETALRKGRSNVKSFTKTVKEDLQPDLQMSI